MYSLIEWQFKEGKFWKPFGKEDNVAIEESYRAKRSKIIVDHGWNNRFVIDFTRWEMQNQMSYGRRFEIQRIVRLTPEQKREKENQRILEDFLKKNLSKVTNIFEDYKDGDKVMGMDGVLALLEDLDLDPMDISVLVLCWLCNAKTQASFAFEEFALGMAKLNCTTIKALKTKLMARSKNTVKDFKEFEDLYMYAFVYMKEGANLSREAAIAYWELLLSAREEEYVYVDEFVSFLRDEEMVKKYSIPRSVSRDTWTQMLKFFCDLKEDMAGYDTASCPSLADSFVEYLTQKRKEETSTTTTQHKEADDEDDMDW